MTNKETRRYEMLVRVRDFGEAHRDLFAKSTPGGEAFAAVADAVRQLSDHAVVRLSTAACRALVSSVGVWTNSAKPEKATMPICVPAFWLWINWLAAASAASMRLG